jgi:hypothetical protein
MDMGAASLRDFGTHSTCYPKVLIYFALILAVMAILKAIGPRFHGKKKEISTASCNTSIHKAEQAKFCFGVGLWEQRQPFATMRSRLFRLLD